VKKARQGTLPELTGYMLKAPSKAYRVRRQADLTKPDGSIRVNADGEVLAKFVQGKSDLRPGEHIRLFKMMRYLYLDGLAFAGGDGVALLARAKSAALRTFRVTCKKQRAKRLSLRRRHRR
jgi:hypothetical protein